MGGFSLTSAPRRAITQDGGHPGDGDHVGAHDCYCLAGKTSGKVQPGWP